MGRFVHHDDIDQGLARNGDGQDDAGDNDVVDDFCPTKTLFFSGLLGQLGERWLKTALLRRQGHGNPPMGDAIDALVALLRKSQTQLPKKDFCLGKNIDEYSSHLILKRK